MPVGVQSGRLAAATWTLVAAASFLRIGPAFAQNPNANPPPSGSPAPAGQPAPGVPQPQAPPVQQPPPGQQPPPVTPPPATPPGAPPPRKRPAIYIGPEVGVFLPTGSKAQHQFGSAWLGYGVSFGGIERLRPGGKFGLDINLVSQTNGDDYTYLGLVGAEYRFPLIPVHRAHPSGGSPAPPPEPRRLLVPYVGVSADVALSYMRAIEIGIRSGIRTGFSGSMFLGLDIGTRAYVEARYIGVTEIGGLDLSGASLNAGYRFKF